MTPAIAVLLAALLTLTGLGVAMPLAALALAHTYRLLRRSHRRGL